MAKEKKHKCPPAGSPLWMCTFADLMSLLLCFFVLLLSFSEMDRQKFKVLSGSMAEAFGVQTQLKVWDMPKGLDMVAREFNEPRFVTDELIKKLRSTLLFATKAQEEEEEGVKVEEGERTVTVSMPNQIMFGPANAEIQRSSFPVLDALRNAIRHYPGRVVVTGHTDNQPIRNSQYPSNWELSAARAASVIRYLLASGELLPERFIAVGMADTKPKAPNTSAKNRSINRRVEISFQKMIGGRPNPSSGNQLTPDQWFEPDGPFDML